MSLYLGTSLISGASSLGGGGGLLNQIKYSTHRADENTFTRILSQFNFTVTVGAVLGGTTASIEPAAGTPAFAAGALVNATFMHPGGQGTTITILTSAEFTGGPGFEITFAAVTEAFLTGQNGIVFPVGLAVNPATDLGLADGDLLGYFMVGGGLSGFSFNQAGGNNENSTGGRGGNILQGTIPIVTAATDLTLTIGLPTLASTITGGLTLSTADGSNQAGWGAAADFNGNSRSEQSSAGPGINGFGVGGGARNERGDNGGLLSHGFGTGGNAAKAVNDQTLNNILGSDGAIILIY